MDNVKRNYVELADDEVLWRRVPGTHVVPDGQGGLRPSSGSFNPHKDDRLLSVYRAIETQDPQALLQGQTGVFFVVGFEARWLKVDNLLIFPDPQPNPPVGHWQVEGTKKKLRRLADHSHWIIPPPKDFEPPPGP